MAGRPLLTTDLLWMETVGIKVGHVLFSIHEGDDMNAFEREFSAVGSTESQEAL